MDACQNYPWPGNLKELQSFVKRYLVAGDEELFDNGLASASNVSTDRTRHDSSAEQKSTPTTLKSMIQNVRWDTERSAIAAALQKTGWNRKAAARLLGVSYRTILYKIEQFQMNAPEPYISSFSETRLTLPTDIKGNGKAS